MARTEKRKVSIVITAKNKAKKVFGSIKRSIGGIKDSVFSLKGLLAGAGLGLLGRDFINTASQFEKLETSLTTVLGSAAKAKEALNFAQKAAEQSPFTVQQYAEAIKTMSAYGIDYKKNMKVVADTAAAMDKPISQAVEALADALQGEGERLKEFGIKQRKEGDKLVYTWTDALGEVRQSVAEDNPKIIAQVLSAIWNEKYAGGAERFKNTWGGLTSTAASNWEDFQNKVMDAGLFDFLKGALEELNEQFGENEDAIDDLADKLGRQLLDSLKGFVRGSADVADALEPVMGRLGDLSGDLWDGFNSLPAWAQEVGIMGALLGGRKGKALLVGAALLTDSMMNIGKAIDAVKDGKLSFTDFATSNSDELEQLLAQIEQQAQQSGSKPSPETNQGKARQAVEKLFKKLDERMESRMAQNQLIEDAGFDPGAQWVRKTVQDVDMLIGKYRRLGVEITEATRAETLKRALKQAAAEMERTAEKTKESGNSYEDSTKKTETAAGKAGKAVEGVGASAEKGVKKAIGALSKLESKLDSVATKAKQTSQSVSMVPSGDYDGQTVFGNDPERLNSIIDRAERTE